jgi:SAM-dependent methyltransferase
LSDLTRQHRAPPPDSLRTAGDFLRKVGYSNEAAREILRADPGLVTDPKRRPLYLQRTSGETPLETLIRLFLLGVPVDPETAARAVAPTSVEEWVELGLLTLEGGSVQASVQLLPLEGFIVALDAPEGLHGRAGDRVATGAATRTLTRLTIRRPVRATLDLGTGSGTLALFASSHSEVVVGTDINPRAVWMASLSAGLSGVEVELREGSLFEPVGGREFDLIVSVPPFAITPEFRQLFMTSNMEGGICQTIAREAPGFLSPGGFCQFLAHWPVPKDGEWHEGLSEWFEGTGCDVWVLHIETHECDNYAVDWINQSVGPKAMDEQFDRWLEFYEREGIQRIASGLITMRPATGSQRWFRADEMPHAHQLAGDDVLLGFEARSFLEANDDRALLGSRFRLSREARLTQEWRRGEGGWEVESTHLRRKESGLDYVQEVERYGAELADRLDGGAPVRDVVEDLAASMSTDVQSITADILKILRQLVEQLFLIPETGDR